MGFGNPIATLLKAIGALWLLMSWVTNPNGVLSIPRAPAGGCPG